MAYTVKALAKLSEVSIRTLHWYDEIGLLKPSFKGANQYRYYEEKDLMRLQQIGSIIEIRMSSFLHAATVLVWPCYLFLPLLLIYRMHTFFVANFQPLT